MRNQLEMKEDRKIGESSNMTLHKLMISKFEASPLDLFQFSNQFDTEIDQQVQISPVTRFSYLKKFFISPGSPLHMRIFPYFNLGLSNQQLLQMLIPSI